MDCEECEAEDRDVFEQIWFELVQVGSVLCTHPNLQLPTGFDAIFAYLMGDSPTAYCPDCEASIEFCV